MCGCGRVCVHVWRFKNHTLQAVPRFISQKRVDFELYQTRIDCLRARARSSSRWGNAAQMATRSVQATWIVSLLCQIAALGLVIAALNHESISDAHVFVLWLEVVISGIQFVWCVCKRHTDVHTCTQKKRGASCEQAMRLCARVARYVFVYALVFVYKVPGAVDTRWRYVDWVITTYRTTRLVQPLPVPSAAAHPSLRDYHAPRGCTARPCSSPSTF